MEKGRRKQGEGKEKGRRKERERKDALLGSSAAPSSPFLVPYV